MNPFILENSGPLLSLSPEQKLWAHWLGETTDLDALLPSVFVGSTGLDGPANPINSSFPETYADALIADLQTLIADDAERRSVEKSLLLLKTGKARAVVTGQQPGFAGGPLYSLYKISTTVALARRHTLLGQPTVPVFWMGDDDDDWQEMLDPVFWDSGNDQLISSLLQGERTTGRKPMIGNVAAASIENSGEFSWHGQPMKSSLGETLQSIWKECSRDNDNLSGFSEKILRTVFKGTGLVILRGNDSRLHSAGKSFYEQAVRELPEIIRRVQQQGLKLADLGLQQLNPNSVQRPLYKVEGNSRHPWKGETLPEDTSHLRCGVLLRALLQDWLLNPSAVVVGPGELSYLAQILPVYECLGMQRSPLVPRMFAWVAGSDFSAEDISRFTNEKPLSEKEIQTLAESAGAAGEEKLVEILRKELVLDGDRASQLAAGRTRRWVKGVKALLKNESQKQYLQNRPDKPLWVFPEGKRQERKLAWIPLVAAMGWPLVAAVMEAAEKHLDTGAEGNWHEYLIRIQDSEIR